MLQPEQLPRYFRHIANLYHKVVCRQLDIPQLNNYFDFLLTIDRYEKQLTQKQLAELMYIDKSSMVAIVNYLFEHEFIDVKLNPSDRRENFISLAEKGKQIVSKIRKSESRIYAQMLNGIDKDKISILFETLTNIETSLKQINSSV
jgi:DNA-binding MarR family transcriptional regulator